MNHLTIVSFPLVIKVG